MIQEIINYTKHLKEKAPMVFQKNLEPSKGLHIFIELDKKGELINFPGERGKQWDYYDGKEMTPFLNHIIPYEQESVRIGTSMNKVFDKKKQIASCSPFIVAFKKEKLDNDKLEGDYWNRITYLLSFYFDKAKEECFDKKDEETWQKILAFKNTLTKVIPQSKVFLDNESLSIFDVMKKDAFVCFYFKNITIDDYKTAHNNYLTKNLFNSNAYNSDKKVSNDTYGLSGFRNGMNSKKPFLEHKTASFFKGIASRIQASDTIYLNDFDLLLRRKVFPMPLPIFIDESEFEYGEQMLNIFHDDSKLSYASIQKQVYSKDEDITLKNYYLLFFNYKYELEDYDFVSQFRYSLKKEDYYPRIHNLFELKKGNEIQSAVDLKQIFHFEAVIVGKIFNNALVKIKDDSYSTSYFGEIKPEYVSGGESVYQMIMKYRKAFYDYIYKSKENAITSNMWDDILWNSIVADVCNDSLDKKGYSTKEYGIKEKLNIWFSLYNYFSNSTNRENMASKILELIETIKQVANNDEAVLTSTEEFAFACGQVIYYLLNQSRASERTHALLEPFTQKVKVIQLQSSIAQTINTYKHEISFGKGRFERLSAQVLAYESDVNLKDYQRLLLAGYFAPAAIYEKKEENN